VFSVEYKDDSQIIPRSSSVVVKRLPAARPGKGKAAMYIAAAAGGQSSDSAPKHGGSSNTVIWHRGAMSKRFDGKDEPAFKPATAVRYKTPFVKTAT
jgi:protein MPE1